MTSIIKVDYTYLKKCSPAILLFEGICSPLSETGCFIYKSKHFFGNLDI